MGSNTYLPLFIFITTTFILNYIILGKQKSSISAGFGDFADAGTEQADAKAEEVYRIPE